MTDEPRERAWLRLDALARGYADARRLYEAIDLQRKVQIENLNVATAALFDAMEELGLRSIRTDDLGTFALNDLADAKIEDPARFVAWAKENLPEILGPNYQRLSKLTRDALKGEYEFPGTTSELPPGVTYNTRRNITWRGRGEG